MTSKQRLSILLDRWPAACRTQRWNPKDRELRLQVISAAVGRDIASMNDLDNAADIDKLFAHLGHLAENVARTIETLPAENINVSAGRAAVQQEDTLGYRRRLLWLIRRDARDLGGEPYVLRLARDRFHLVSGLTTITDLTTDQLHQLMITLHARAAKKSNARSDASFQSEEQFPDDIEYLPETGDEPETDYTPAVSDPVAAECPF